ncbi:hypothetical protein F7R21_20345 [Burkholderia latens]|uniref:Uncharacterized protein n=1 Tax=Burkholderia latens TaxID=488446 RepID=A0A6H9SNV1_9BURK|nr:hypothetical protein F7R21_20345 [Burkholderia latens]
MVEDGGSVDGGHGGCLDGADENPDDTPMGLASGALSAAPSRPGARAGFLQNETAAHRQHAAHISPAAHF